MIFRSLLILGVGAAMVLGVSSFASAEPVAKTEQVAAADVEKPQVKKQKTAVKPSQKSKAAAKNKSKKTEAKVEEEAPKSSGGLFAVLFKPQEPAAEKPAAKKLTGKAAREAAAKEKAAGLKAKARKEEPKPAEPVLEIVSTGNNGELRSEVKPQNQDLFSSIFGGSSKQSLLPETRALDAVLAAKDAKKKFKVKSDFEPQQVSYSGYKPGTIVVDTSSRYLYLVETSSTARRYAIAVGREGLEFKGTAKIGDKQEWPRWIPTQDMQKREPKKYGQYKDGMPGGPENPLGARAMYLYQGNKDTHIRIHGTNQPQTIGTNSSNGCFRMINDHVKDLYGRVKMGTDVVVL